MLVATVCVKTLPPTGDGVVAGKKRQFVLPPVHYLCLAGERQLVIAVDHRLAPGNPAFVSAASKKSFSNASSPILA